MLYICIVPKLISVRVKLKKKFQDFNIDIRLINLEKILVIVFDMCM